MKTNYEKFITMLQCYLDRYDIYISLEETITEASRNTDSNQELCTGNMKVLNLDHFAKKGYRIIILPQSKSEKDSINTADAFIIDHYNQWFFIEFKDSTIGQSKHSVIKKGYSSVYALMNVLYQMHQDDAQYESFTYENPVEFFQKNAKYIVVFSSQKDAYSMTEYRNHKLINENYTPEVLKTIKGYIYKDAYAIPEYVFEKEFLKKFIY